MALATFYSRGGRIAVCEPSSACDEFVFITTAHDERESRTIGLTRAQARDLAGKLLAYLDETEQDDG